MLKYSDVEMVEVTLYDEYERADSRVVIRLTNNLDDNINCYRSMGYRIRRVSRFTAYNYDVREV